MFVPQAQSLLKGVQILRIVDGRQGGPINGAVLIHGLTGDVLGVRHLLRQDHDS
jgi:hypothetical protein